MFFFTLQLSGLAAAGKGSPALPPSSSSSYQHVRSPQSTKNWLRKLNGHKTNAAHITWMLYLPELPQPGSGKRSRGRSSAALSKKLFNGLSCSMKSHKLLFIQKVMMWWNPNQFVQRHEMVSLEKPPLGLNLTRQAPKSLFPQNGGSGCFKQNVSGQFYKMFPTPFMKI